MSPSPPTARSRRSQPGSGLGLAAVLAIIGLLVAYLGVLELSRPHVSGDRLRLDAFMAMAEDGRIKSAEILDYDSYVVGEYVAGSGDAGGGVQPGHEGHDHSGSGGGDGAAQGPVRRYDAP